MSSFIWVVMSTSSDTPIGKVTEFVDMESVFAWGKSRESSLDLDFMTSLLNELDDTTDTRISILVENTNTVVCRK